jgi:CRP-like cAMP-binding protein
MTELDLLAHTAYAVLLLSFLMRDILWLRVFSVVSGGFVIPFYYLQPEPLWPCIAWNSAFVTVNLYWITRLLIERRPVHFSPQEQRLYDKALRALKPRHARKLFEAAQWKTVAAGECIMVQGRPSNTLSLVAEGRFTLEMDGMIVDEIGMARFVGSYAFLKNVKDFPAPITVTAAKTSKVAVWQNAELRDLIDNDTELSRAVEASLGLELAHLLDHARADLEFSTKIDLLARKELPVKPVVRGEGLGSAAAG